MARLGYIMVCEDVGGQGDNMFITKPFNVITPYSVPGNFSFVVSFALIDLTPGKNHQLLLEVKDPDDDNLITQTFDFEFSPPNTGEKKEKIASGVINLKFNNVVFQKTGDHVFKVTVDNSSSNKLTIPVFSSGA